MTEAWYDVRRSDLERLRVIEGLTWREIAARYGVCTKTVWNTARYWQIPKRPRPALSSWQALTDPDLRRIYTVDRLSHREIGARYGISHTTVRTRLRTLGIAAGVYGSRGRLTWAAVSRDDLFRLYWQERLSTTEIGRRYHVRQGTVATRMRALDIPRRPKGAHAPPLWDALPDRELARLYHEDDLSTQEIATRFGVTPISVRRRLDLAGIPRKARSYFPRPHPWHGRLEEEHKARYRAMREEHLAAYHDWLAAREPAP